MKARSDLEAALRAVGESRDSRIDIAGAALTLAALDRPRTALEPYRSHLDEIARDLAREAEGGLDLGARIDALNRVLFGRYGYTGDVETYDDPENADLIRVIDRRKGLPVSLGILAMHAARAQGWNLVGLGFPAHFLLRFDQAGQRAILDPFHGGRRLGPNELRELLKGIAGQGAELEPEMYAPVDDRAVLLRLQNNIKTRALRSGDIERAIAIAERMVLIAPGSTELWRELGSLRARIGNLRGGLRALEEALKLSTGAGERERTARLLDRLRLALH